jgi:DNA mismatch endonuclease (patch repair protein)
MAAARESGWSVVIVSNNSGPAISAYLAAHDLTRYVHAVFGRDDPDPAKMKPDPYRVHEAIASVDATPSQCLLIGDSPSDVTAAQAAGVIPIGFANKPGKDRLLLRAGAERTVTDISQVAMALRESQRSSTKGQPWATTRRARAVMLGNRSRDTKPELAVRSALHALRMRYRVATRPLPTLNRTADIVFRRARVAVFVDGCFWHGCPEHYVRSASNIKYWDDKIRKNRERDADTDKRLMASGWLTVRIWEHRDPIAAANDIAELVRQRLAVLDSGRADPPVS